MITTFLFLSLVTANPDTTLKMEGAEGVKIFGFCVSTDGPTEKKFEGVTPTEVHFDTTLKSCKLSAEGESKKFTVRVYQNRRFVTEREFSSPTSGIEWVIPLGKSKK